VVMGYNYIDELSILGFGFLKREGCMIELSMMLGSIMVVGGVEICR
jgi:hypothetical protein